MLSINTVASTNAPLVFCGFHIENGIVNPERSNPGKSVNGIVYSKKPFASSIPV